MQEFKKKIVSTEGGQIATWEAGNGPSLVFLNGGPGDTHHYMARMAEPLVSNFRCVFFDQRGTGESNSFGLVASNFKLHLLLSDLQNICAELQLQNPSLVGHSWGAMYALFASLKFPNFFPKAALLSMGPLDSEMGAKTNENMSKVFTKEENILWENLREQRNKARDLGDAEKVKELDKQMMQLRVKSWIFLPSLYQTFLQDYFQDPPTNREVHKLTWQGAENWFEWENLKIATTQYFVCSGVHDSIPISQIEKFKTFLPQTKTCILENCGHIPWLEQPEKFYRELTSFFAFK